MRVLLMYRDQDLDLDQQLPSNEADLTLDLELDALFDAMADGDKFIRAVARLAVLTGPVELDAIRYRQAVLRDCLDNPDVIRQLYGVALEALQNERRHWSPMHSSPRGLLSRSLSVLGGFVESLRQLRELGDANHERFSSEAFARLFGMLDEELTDEYFAQVRGQMELLKVEQGTLLSAHLGPGNKGADYVLREPDEQSWRDRLSLQRKGHSFQIAERDQAGARAISELGDRGINLAANALAQSVEHILGFFRLLLAELAFYIGCLNLRELLAAAGEPTCIPEPVAASEQALSARGLYDVSLSLRGEGRVVGNDLDADGRPMLVITGANRGGKSTLLRALGLAQLMLQAGMFVGAEQLRASVRDGVFTHYKREEDATMTSGKLVEELVRMSSLAELMNERSLLLCEESFASTNEREGSEIARQVVTALTGRGVRVMLVTHMYDLSHYLHETMAAAGLFLRADPEADGSRTFRLHEGEPLPHSYGAETYGRIFGGDESRSLGARLS